ncbi:MAG: TonB family protein [Bacteroidales bacterium]|nr:TonB family protein [Bacteroidales bacterium]
MEKRKTEKADLENKKGLFLQIGLVFTLGVILLAFEWKTYDVVLVVDSRAVVEMEEDIVINTETPPPPPPPPPPQEITTELEIVADDKVIENEVEINAEADERTAIEVYIAPVIEAEDEEEEHVIFQVVEDAPGYPGGEEERMRFLRDNIRYPAIARESGIQGTIFITFVVERDGSITDVKIVRGIGGGCDEEAIRVVQNMPRWVPGKQRGRAVRVQFMMPIRFTLSG